MIARILTSLVVVGAGVALMRLLDQPDEVSFVQSVRDAGPDNMVAPPDDWDMVDQQADESFPASDPPGNY